MELQHYLLQYNLPSFSTGAAELMGVSNLTGKRFKISKIQLFQIIYYSVIAPLILFILIFSLLIGVNLIFWYTGVNLIVKESLFIKRDNPVLNKTTKLFPLELFPFYYHCFLVLYQILLLFYPRDWYCNYYINILN